MGQPLLSQEQLKAITDLESRIQSLKIQNDKDPGLILNQNCFMRFLIARDWDVSKAESMMKDWIKWRIEKKPHLITPSMIRNEVKCEKAYWCGRDKEGAPIVVVKPYNHFANERDYDEVSTYVMKLKQ